MSRRDPPARFGLKGDLPVLVLGLNPKSAWRVRTSPFLGRDRFSQFFHQWRKPRPHSFINKTLFACEQPFLRLVHDSRQRFFAQRLCRCSCKEWNFPHVGYKSQHKQHRSTRIPPFVDNSRKPKAFIPPHRLWIDHDFVRRPRKHR